MEAFRKSLEALLYIVSNTPNPNVFWVCKVLYHADKEHLAEFGRLITDDRYIAMENGPVPSQMYDIYKDVRYGREENGGYDVSKAAFSVEGNRIVPLREPDVGFLSPSDIKCIDSAIARVGEMEFGELSHLSHDEAWQSTITNSAMSLNDIAKMLDASGDLERHLFEKPR